MSESMSPKEKFKAMRALDNWMYIAMDCNDNWYVHWAIEIGGDGMLAGMGSHEATPEAAIEAHWKEATELAPGSYLVKNAYSDGRRHFRWNGFMWEELAQDKSKD